VGDYLHISQRTYSHYENGTRNIPTDILIHIADLYNVSIDYLFERTKNKEINR
jgi:transcriptional regulator with XRE-family HTH domain